MLQVIPEVPIGHVLQDQKALLSFHAIAEQGNQVTVMHARNDFHFRLELALSLQSEQSRLKGSRKKARKQSRV